MNNLDHILAKSEKKDYEPCPLKNHLQQVAEACQAIAKGVGLDEETAYLGGILHDIGKAHPTFQTRLTESFNPLADRFIFRHEITSLAFLSFFPENIYPELIEMVVAHHKSVDDAKGLLGMDDGDEHYLKRHLEGWEQWSPDAIEILRQLLKDRGIIIADDFTLSQTQARSNIEKACEYCRNAGKSWSAWRGLLMSADHMISAIGKTDHLKDLFHTPDISVIERQYMPSHLFPLSWIATDDPRPHTLLVAPTGAGKTEFMLRRCRGRIFYVLPFQASINAMYERLKKALDGTLPNTAIRFLHASSRLAKGNQEEESIALQPFIGAAIKVLTPYQLAGIVFATGGFEGLLLDLQGADVILDEIHTYQEVAQAMTLALVRVLVHHGCRLHIGTATMPTALYSQLKAILGEENTYEVHLTDEQLATYNRHRIHKLADESDIETLIANGLKASEKILIVCNTVSRAQEMYKQLRDRFSEYDSMLIHSRFRRKDRAKRESDLKEVYNQNTQPCFVVSTQVVEVSLDISFDRMITDAAPLDALIQRFGRVNRKRTPETIGRIASIHILPPAEKTLPYQKDFVMPSFEVLPDGEVLETVRLQELLDRVYPTVEVQSIESHVAWRFEAGMKLKLRKLCSKSKAILMDILEIEGATCILASDQEDYLKGKWQDRQQYEIPVSPQAIWGAFKDQTPQRLDKGSNPYVINQDKDSYNLYGLQFNAPETIF